MNEPRTECQQGYEERIRRLELEARPLDPGPKERAILRDKFVAYADNFIERIDSRPVFLVSEGEDGALYDSPISEESADPDEALNLLDRGVIQSGVNVGSAGHFAYIPGSNLYVSALADYLTAVTNRYSGLYFASPGAVRMERILLRWMAGFLGYPAASAGDLTSGGSIANLVGIVTAREAHGLKARDFDRAVVYLSEQTHHAIDKALRIAGLKESLKRSRTRWMSKKGLPATTTPGCLRTVTCPVHWEMKTDGERERKRKCNRELLRDRVPRQFSDHTIAVTVRVAYLVGAFVSQAGVVSLPFCCREAEHGVSTSV